jgi:ubiquinone/menaquinone biosynthesis C-methylase UbiE
MPSRPASSHPAPSPTPASSAQSFDGFAATYDRFAELNDHPWGAYLRGTLPGQGGRALDLGCGTGRHASLVAERYDTVLAVDMSGPMLDLARERQNRPNITYVQRDLAHVTPERDGHFDLVLSVHTLHHVADLDAALRQIRSLVAPGGLAVLLDIVHKRGHAPRWRLRCAAIAQLLADVAHRRRPGKEAFEVYRLNTHPGWLAHRATDRFLHPAAFRTRYTETFRGAEFTDIPPGCAMRWQAPALGT